MKFKSIISLKTGYILFFIKNKNSGMRINKHVFFINKIFFGRKERNDIQITLILSINYIIQQVREI